MGKVIDLEEARQQAKARAKELKGNGGFRIIHIMRKWKWKTDKEGEQGETN